MRKMVNAMKSKKEIYKNPYFILFAVTVLICAFFCGKNGMFGSKVDWISQHSVLPEYFRRHFYETKKLFPEFALNIGGGQNIYHFSYYGLYSPIVLLSYLFPFIKMSDYMMAAQFLCLAASVLMMYRWLINQKFSLKISFGTALIFLLAGPMIFQSYSQIMFVNYMPFLCLAFMGVDDYFQKPGERNSGRLIIGVFLMIMTSFYFSIGGMLAITLYGIYRYFMMCEVHKRAVTFFSFFKEACMFALRMIAPIMMSGILLIPTAMALTGREDSSSSINLLQVFAPDISLKRFFYDPYGIGLTTLAFTALIAMLFFRKKHEKILAWGCLLILLIPLFAYLLNGGLYIRDKVMIPFLPLLCYIVAYYLNWMEQTGKDHIPLFWGSIPYVVTMILIILKREQFEATDYWILILADSTIMLICYLIFYKKRNILVFLIPSLVFLLLFGSVFHIQSDRLIDKRFYQQLTDESIGEMISETMESEKGFYRTEQLGSNDENAADLNRIWDMRQYISSIYSSSYNENYQDFRKDIFQIEQPFRNFLMQSAVANPVYHKFMGVKYTISNGKVYKDDTVSPIAYATNRIISEDEYRKLEFPYNQLALLQYAVTDEKGKKLDESLQQADILDCKLPSSIKSDQNQTVWIHTAKDSKKAERVLFIKFQVKNLRRSKDISIWIEGKRNKLTAQNHFYYNNNTEFHYAVPLKEGQKDAEVVFGQGNYQISDVECYLTDLSLIAVDQNPLYQSEFVPNKDKTKDNVISGTINVKNKGYFVTTIPYDEQFEIWVDGKKVPIEKVNTSFLGCRIDRGTHEIEMIYHAAGVEFGKAVSLIGLILCLVMLGKEFLRMKELLH
ncbi:MAG: YfhO family protein [Lachnospiraceae bacterium]|nr:YfhO family protein [Lachnospiraceae bacterium]